MGFTASAPRIAKLVVDEYDDNNIFPDANIGFDTFRYTTHPAASPVTVRWAVRDRA